MSTRHPFTWAYVTSLALCHQRQSQTVGVHASTFSAFTVTSSSLKVTPRKINFPYPALSYFKYCTPCPLAIGRKTHGNHTGSETTIATNPANISPKILNTLRFRFPNAMVFLANHS